MKKIKFKLLSAVTIVLSLLITTNVSADEYNGYIVEGETIPGVYFYKHRDDTNEVTYEFHNFHKQATVYRDSLTNKFVYCIESWEKLNGAGSGDYTKSAEYSFNILSKEKQERIKKLAYFGYGYKDKRYDHTDLKWYAITQYLIWLEQAPSNYEHYFVSSISSTKPINPFDNEINELNALIEHEATLPLINDKTAFINETIVVDFKDYDINDFQIKNSFAYTIENNKMLITRSLKGGRTVEIIKKFNYYQELPEFFVSDNYQDAMSVGNLEELSETFRTEFVAGKVNVNVFEEIRNSDKYKKLNDFEVGIYANEDIQSGDRVILKDELVSSGKTKSGVVKFTNLLKGKYYIKELSNIDNYIDDEAIYDVEITDSTLKEVDIYHHLQKLKVSFTKKIEVFNNQQYDYIASPNIKFAIYDYKDNLIAEDITNEFGYIDFYLDIPYGNYYIKEISTLDGYDLDNNKYNIEFKCIGSSLVQEQINLYEFKNELKKGMIKIIKKDELTRESLKGVEFTIMNENKEIIKVLKTDEFGVIEYTLPYGNYYIKETDTLEDYILNDEEINITLNSNLREINLTNEKRVTETEVIIEPTDAYSFVELITVFLSGVLFVVKKYV